VTAADGALAQLKAAVARSTSAAPTTSADPRKPRLHAERQRHTQGGETR
jgi:hypothetical protein